MKLTLIGGGGVRAPLFVNSTLKRAARLQLEELCLIDNDPEKLQIMGSVCRMVARQAHSPVKISTTTDAPTAVSGADYVVTSIRVGNEQGRIFDERIALRHGVLGQETTGPGGFAMALRSIPAILDYAALIQEVSPEAWMFNFTNPAGLVTQALRDAGYEKTVGICDSANGSQQAVAQFLGVPAADVRHEVYGLNHLSWARRVWVDGEDVLPGLLQTPEFLSGTGLDIYEPQLVQQMGAWLNEYLYYFYYAEQALERIQEDELTRGEEILQLNKTLLHNLKQVDFTADPQTVLPIYYRYEQRRTATYMHYAHDDAPSIEDADDVVAALQPPTDGGEGYAGVALDIIEAFHTQEPLHIALNVPNEGAIAGMGPEDVVEVSCTVDSDGIHPQFIGAIPEDRELLMRQVKLYERLTVEAVRERNRETAVRALMAHPLVLSYSRAKILVDEYLQAHAPYVGEWE